MKPLPPVKDIQQSNFLDKFHADHLEIPIEALKLFWDTRITLTEVLLVSFVNMLVNVNRNEGCYASNKRLALHAMARNPKKVSSMISKLKRLGLIREVGYKVTKFGRIRVLDTKWRPIGGVILKDNRGVILKDNPYSSSLRSEELHSITDPAPQGSGELMTPSKGDNEMSTKHGFNVRLGMNTDNKIAKMDLMCAHQLRRAVISNSGAQTYSHQPNKWANEFKILRSRRHIGDICSVLDWLEENAKSLRDERVFFPKNAKVFRQHFDSLLERMNKDPKRIQVTFEAEQHALALKLLQWPKGAAEQLPQAVQITLENFQQLWRRLKDYTTDNPELIIQGKKVTYAEPHVKLAHQIIQVIIPGSRTLDWFHSLYARVKDWKDWSGNIISGAWHGELLSKQFKKFIMPFVIRHVPAKDADRTWSTLAKEVES